MYPVEKMKMGYNVRVGGHNELHKGLFVWSYKLSILWNFSSPKVITVANCLLDEMSYCHIVDQTKSVYTYPNWRTFSQGFQFVGVVNIQPVVGWYWCCTCRIPSRYIPSLSLDRVKRIWYLSPIRAARVQASLRIRAVSPEPSLLAHTSSESRGTFITETSPYSFGIFR